MSKRFHQLANRARGICSAALNENLLRLHLVRQVAPSLCRVHQQARTFKHQHKWYADSFTARYNFDMVVHVERYSDPYMAIEREKEIKGWRREKKLRLILASNPDWADLSAEWRDDESWQSIPEAKPRWVLRRHPPQS